MSVGNKIALPCFLAGLWLAIPAAAAAPAYTILYNFCEQASCTDGANPLTSPPILDHSGSGILYGATKEGGDTNQGTVYALTPTSAGTYSHRRLHSFCQGRCHDGFQPIGPLVQDTAGNLYGINEQSAFELSPNAKQSRWRISRTKLFGDGFNLTGGLTYAGAAQGHAYDGTSPLYGMTFAGGDFLQGTVYQLVPDGGRFRRKVLYSFCAEPNCSDGQLPSNAILHMDGNGTLYGTTEFGGANGAGVLFSLAPNRSQTRWTERVLYNFCARAKCADGRQPLAGVVQNPAGDLYGTTNFAQIMGESGTLYKFHLGRQPKFSVLHAFCENDCSDGAAPDALSFDPFGNLIGTTVASKTGNAGNIFRYSLSSQGFELLHSFCQIDACADGALPSGALAIDGVGNMFGATAKGGTNSGGVVFRLTP
jgi:uncharacterized repeat protein (TIGR03803 family)